MAVYIIQVGANGPVKIGFSTNPTERIATLQTGWPSPLRWLAVFEGSLDDEAALHVRFAEHRVRGEWFEPATAILEFAASKGVTIEQPPKPPRAEPGMLSVVAAEYADIVPRVLRAYHPDQIAEWSGMTPRSVENWLGGHASPNLAAFIALAQHIPEFRDWIVAHLSVDEDPARALAVIANALARRQA